MKSEKRKYRVIEECAESYRVRENPDGSVDIYMHVPKRFNYLVRDKMEALETDDEEIARYED